MSIRTPFARVEGLGAAHEGPHHFWRQRITAVALVLLSIWFVFAAVHLIGAPYAQARVFLGAPVHAVLTILFVLALVIHMMLGIQVVIEDYVHGAGRIVLLLLNRAFGWIVGVVCIFAILKIAFQVG